MGHEITWRELLADVDARFAAMDPPSWPDPHRYTEPDEDEHGRISDRRRFDLPTMRVQAWTRALVAAGLAQVETTPVPEGCSAAYGLRARRPGTLLLLVETTVEGHTNLAIEDPQILIGWGPNCGCDACDHGSELLLDYFETLLTSVVSGQLEVEQTATRRSVTHSRGGSSGTHGLDAPLLGTWCGLPWLE